MEELIVIGSTQGHCAYSTDEIAPTLTAIMGSGGGNTPIVIYEDDED